MVKKLVENVKADELEALQRVLSVSKSVRGGEGEDQFVGVRVTCLMLHSTEVMRFDDERVIKML